MNIQGNVNLSQYTTFNVGGLAKFFVEAVSVENLKDALVFANTKKLSVFLLGGGSNILISDDGFDGLVIRNNIKGLKINDSGEVVGSSGEIWDEVVKRSVEKNLAGIECLSGVPGSLGGAVVQNIGCYGQTFGDVVEKVSAFNLVTGQLEDFDAARCQFAYRTSFFKNNPQYIVVNVFLKLIPNGSSTVIYKDVVEYFRSKPNPTLIEVRQALFEIRAKKGMVISPKYESYKSAGSFFKNPIVDKNIFNKIKATLNPNDNRVWFWEQPDGRIKISAARIVVAAGFSKGYTNGNVGISPLQPLAIINLRKASAFEIKNFAEKIKSTVKNKFNIDLEEEIVYLGNFTH